MGVGVNYGAVTIGNGDVTLMLVVNVIHYSTKELSMGTCVLEGVKVYIIMDQLMDNNVLEIGFGQFESCTNVNGEVIFFIKAIGSASAFVAQLSHIGLCVC